VAGVSAALVTKVADTQRVAIITGAGTGLGKATAEVLGESGIACALVGRRSGPLAETAGGAFPAGVLTIAADTSAADDRARIVSETLDRFGRIDILVNNAGVSGRAALLEYGVEDWRRVMETNLEALFFLSQAVLPTMRAQRYGRIVNVGSVYGSLGLNAQLYPGMFADQGDAGPERQPAYHTSKGGVLNLTRDLAAAVARWGVTVNTLSPGMFLTEQSKGIVSDEVVRSLSEMTPVGRFGEPREVGYAVRFLASEEAAFITGAELRVDGGWSIW
jgi:NAD(P)-dependent dehydrogenase (short-subunit alcohol dehydrogenase family)